MKNKIKNKIDLIKLKIELMVAKGMIAEIMTEVDWNEDRLTTENQLRLNKLKATIHIVEDALKLQ